MVHAARRGGRKETSDLSPNFLRRAAALRGHPRMGPVTSEIRKTSWRATAPFRLGEWEVLPASGELRGRRGIERLRPLLMDVLLRLAFGAGEVVRRETLLEDVWPRRMVNDEVLSRAIAELRNHLGDDARGARYIETLPKIGYRLLAPVEAITAAEASLAPPAAPARPAPLADSRSRGVLWLAGALAAAAFGVGAWALWRHGAAPAHDFERQLAGARPLTSDPALELAPRFSPEGDRVAFALGEGSDSRIVIQALDGTSRQFVGSAAGTLRHSPAFFPDGKRIAFFRRSGRECAIVEHDLATGAERVLLDCAQSPAPRFDLSRDGRFLVFSAAARPQHPLGLWVKEIGGGAPRALTAPEPGMGDDLFPRFSPDGRRIAFFRGSDSHRHPWIVSSGDGKGSRVAPNVEGLSYGLAWTAAGGPVIAAADWFGFRALNVIDPAGGNARLIGARGARFPDVSARGDIVWENAVYAANVWRVDLGAGGEPKVLWRSTRYSSQPEFSPDGKTVLFSSNRDGSDAIYVAALDGAPRRIAFGDEPRYLRPHWAADGRSVLAVRITTSAAGAAIQEAVRIPAQGGAPELIAAAGKAVNDMRETRDGRWLVWGELSGHAMRIMRAPTADPTRAERLPWPLASHYEMNAERAVLAQPQLRVLTSCRLDTLACEPLELEVPDADLYHWELGARSLFLRMREDGAARIVRYDLASRRVVGRIPFAPSGAGTSLAVSPDESVLLVVREEGPAIDLMIARR
jgi:Tol biopolymer transport system component/DNA-binding winged helix-turn-helix (wHTH) protein